MPTRREFLKGALATIAVVLFGPSVSLPERVSALDSNIRTEQSGGIVSPETMARFWSSFEDTWGEVSVPWTVVMRPELYHELSSLETVIV